MQPLEITAEAAQGAVAQGGRTTARVNGVPLHAEHESLDEAVLRQRACTELLRQAAQRQGLLAADDAPGVAATGDDAGGSGAISDAAAQAIEQLLERELRTPDPDEAACRRHHAANRARFRPGDRVRLRHVLFAVTPGVDVVALRRRAEALLIELRCADAGGSAFAEAASRLSNCPSGAQGGQLGWLSAADMAPEFGRAVLAHGERGVMPRLVHSRHGLHVVEVLEREVAADPPYEAVRDAVARELQRHTWLAALRQYLQRLAGEARLEGVTLAAAATPLVQ